MKKDQDIYTKIFKALDEGIKPDWTRIEMNLRRSPTACKYSGRILNADTNDWDQLNVDLPFINRWLRELKDFTDANQFKDWNALEFIFEEDGKFDVEFKWDQSWHDEYEKAKRES